MDKLTSSLLDQFSENMAKPKKVGLYFGSFNPIHIGHIILADFIAQENIVDEVWFVVSPHNPHKKKNNLLDEVHRMSMVRIAVEDNPLLYASDIEYSLPRPSYTSYTLAALKEKYPDYSFALIMGEDNLRTFHKWKNFEHILENHSILVYPRVATLQELEQGVEKTNGLEQHKHVQVLDAPLMKISSSFIRNQIQKGRSVRYLMPPKVFTFLDEMNFYK